MIKFSMKHAVAAAVLAGASVGASAEDQNLGTITAGGDPVTFSNVVSGTSWSDTFFFTPSEPNIGAAATVVDIPLSFSGYNFDTGLATLTLMSAGMNQMAGDTDDVMLGSATFDPSNPGPFGNNLLSLTHEGSLSGLHYLNVTGVTSGTEGGVYSGAIAVVPEPETYAMLLAGLGLMAGVVRRRSMRKGS